MTSVATPIAVRHLTKRFPAHPGGSRSASAGTTAVDAVSLDIAPGELFFLLGPSGCGKTTLLRMIAGFIEPTSGQILFRGRDVAHLPPNRRNTGMVFQSYALWPHMTVEANVAYGLKIRGIGAEEKARRVREALALVHMEPYAHRKPNQLSGGQQQRIALARALVIRPDVLLLDEPLSNLDAKLRIELRSEIRRICKQVGRLSVPSGVGRLSEPSPAATPGITTIYVTHDQKEALSMADRIAIMDAGKVAQVGTPQELYRRPATRFVAEFLGETNFIDGIIRESSPPSAAGTHITIETPAGPLLAAIPCHTKAGEQEPTAAGLSPTAMFARPGARITCSIRPESFRLVPSNGHATAAAGPNILTGRILETTYLGELAQHTVELPGPTLLRISQLNPPTPAAAASSHIQLTIDPDDIVLVPPEV